MKYFLPRMLRDRRRGLALIIVITTISLISILVVAIFSVTRTEYKATQGFVSARSAKQLADMSTAIVQGQIANAHNQKTAPLERTIHSTQPGMVRVYNAAGVFKRAHKLYSSSQMIVAGGTEAVLFTGTQMVPTDWNSAANKARYVDLNEPVIRPSQTPGSYAVYFPIIDPRAAAPATVSADPFPVEGFSYSKQTPQAGSVTYQEVITAADAGSEKNKMRLPMPVEWLYVLQDGTTGTLSASNEFISSVPGVTASAQNPIVGRVAFWTDDETCKVNINTASEPTFFAPPYFYHQRDYQWANFPPSSGEYQRYPGHPATVALSTVLAPGVSLDPMKSGVNVANVVETKEMIYELAPKIAMGGSKSGTLPFIARFPVSMDDLSSGRGESTISTISDAAAARSERLYSSVDDLIFKDAAYVGSQRPAALYTLPGGSGRRMFDRETIERSRFFLTAQSRAPEFSIHGLPRITMWPVADEGAGRERRTSFDNIIALCSTLQPASAGAAVKNSYIFRRAQPHHPTHDVTGSSNAFGSSTGMKRNSNLLDYLYEQMNGLNFPASASTGATGNTFGQKYGTNNIAQMSVQFFDYIRCTNLYDGILARQNDGWDGNGLSGTNLYVKNDQKEGTFYTYTNHRVTRKAEGNLRNTPNRGSDLDSDKSAVFPGHGTVTPAVWQKGGTSYRGMGRFFTLSEVGFQFICTADGKNDQFAISVDGQESGGGSAPASDPTFGNRVTRDTRSGAPRRPGHKLQKDQDHQRYYSNFPPLLPIKGVEAPDNLYGCDPTAGPANINPKHPYHHPGYNPRNWNMTLPNQTPLQAPGPGQPGQKRIQAMMLLETFCPMLGWTKMYPEFAIELDRDYIGQIFLGTERLFDTTSANMVVKSNANLYQQGTNTYSLGGHASPSDLAGNRDARPISGSGDVKLPSDSGFDLNNTSGHNALSNYGLNSNFITVDRSKPMTVTFPNRPMVIRLYDSHRYQELGLAPVQVIYISFPESMSVPVPALAYSMQRGNIPYDPNELQETFTTDSEGRLNYWRALPGPHWWCLNRGGCLDRMRGQVNPAYTRTNANEQPFWLQVPSLPLPGEDDSVARQVFRGRLDTSAAHFGHESSHGSAQGVPIIPRETVDNTIDTDTNTPWSGTDVIRTMVPAVGDYRLIMARYEVPADMWMQHPVWKQEETKGLTAKKTIHSFTAHNANGEPGVLLEPATSTPTNNQLIAGLSYIDVSGGDRDYRGRRPDLPPDQGWGLVANSFGDFDNGIGNSRDGPWVNKPDEGNFFAGRFTRFTQERFYRSGYFFNPWNNSEDWRSGIYMTPNRVVSSPVMFGSLPTGVWGGGNVPSSADPLNGSGVNYDSTKGGKPWQTLLFRPYVRSHANLGKSGHPGSVNPRDHYLLDMFTMPVVEPYAISEPLSTAGKINLNYQIMPFTNIRRATALHALMKGEFMTTIPNNMDAHKAKEFYSSTNRFTDNQRQALWGGSQGDLTWSETTSPDRKFWHRPINLDATLAQFDRKFNLGSTQGTPHSATVYNGLFRSASQICEMHLVPDVSGGASDGGENVSSVNGLTSTSTASQVETSMTTFWQNHSPTGDNTRERPYSNLYARVTTRSNTFRVHVRAQLVRKARSVEANKFDPLKDAIVSEYRGSSLIERFIDPTNAAIALPDYGASSTPLTEKPLETYYQFRTLESKRFSP